MNKKTVKIISGILLAILLVGFMSTFAFAADTTGAISPDQVTPTYGDSAGLTTMAGKVVGLIRNIAVIGGVVILMILGVKYMLGSTEEKADYKKSLIPLVVGVLVVMAATQIMTFLVSFFETSGN
jgi:type IV secretory pathway VirB2 component (pilin)